MTDIKIIMSWLEGLAEPDWRMFHSDSEVQTIAKETLVLLKEQEVRLLTEEEATAWCEDYNGESVRKKPLVEEYLRPFDKAHWFEWITPDDDYFTADIVGYNEQVRLWTGMPTEEQWKAEKWKE